MARPKRTNMEYLVDFMKKNPNATYAEAAAACKKGGKQVYPIMWGRAQVMLGRKAAKKRTTKAAPAAPAAPKRRGRPPGSKNKPKAVGAEGVVPAKRRGRPAGSKNKPKSQAAAAGGIPLTITDDGDLERWVSLVNQLNEGGKVALRYGEGGWVLAQG